MSSSFTPSVVSVATVPTSMDDATATRLGLKVYSHGTTYFNGIAPTITMTAGSSLTSVPTSAFLPYQLQSGAWRLKFNFHAVVSSAARAVAGFSVAGVTTIAQYQAIATTVLGGAIPCQGYADLGQITLGVVVHASATTTAYVMSGDVELVSKPTWAY